MKVLIIASYARSLLNFRGALIQSLVKQGHQVVALAPETGYESMLRELGAQYLSVPLDRTGMNVFKDIRTFAVLMRIMGELKPDAVLLYTIKPVIYGSLAARFARVPAIYSMITGLGYVFTGRSGKQRFLSSIVHRLYRFALRYNRGIFFQNPDDLAEFCALGVVEEAANTFVINGSGVDINHFSPAAFPEATVSFLLIARLLYEKGISEFVQAARALKSKYPRTRFLLLGPLDTNPAAISEAVLQAWIREEAIEYLGEAEDVRPAITASNVYVLPSYREGTPRTVLEAMAMGRPVVTTDAPGCRETVRDGDNGFLVPVGDAVALARAMERFILEPELVERMGRRSRCIAVDKYDVHKVNAVIMNTMGLLDETGH